MLGNSGASQDSGRARQPDDSSDSAPKHSGPKIHLAQQHRSVKRFIDDAAAGGSRLKERGQAIDDQQSDSEPEPIVITAHEAKGRANTGHATKAQVLALDTSSSDSDGPLATRSSGSVPSAQQRASDHDSDFASEPSSSLGAPGPSAKPLTDAPLRSVNDLHKAADKGTSHRKRHHSSNETEQSEPKQPGGGVGPSAGTDSKQQQYRATSMEKHLQRTPAAAAAVVAAQAARAGDAQVEADVMEGDRSILGLGAGALLAQDSARVAEQAIPAFKMPSQMPKELQTWAWDKYVPQSCLLPPGLPSIMFVQM